MSGDQPAHVVIVGGGFAGVACARRLAGQPGVRVTLLERNGYHQFQPLLYQVATAELTPDDIRFDLEAMFAKDDNVEVRTAEVTAVDPSAPSVTLAGGEVVAGDVVVLAAGSQPNFFHTPGADRHTFPLYSLEDAQRVRSRVLQLIEDARAKPELVDEGALTFVIVGAGATGVETAGSLAELVHEVMPHVHPHLAVAGA
ncbi:MAG TPA: FAD-dependent oxidoreductase, partial [Actinomycetota bacterium]|nr:FAD-dependent oxidoreductase [Actinomycetota bacterium]